MPLLLTSMAIKVMEKALPLLGKAPEQCKIICIPTAANVYDDPKEWFYQELDEFRRLGFALTMFDLDGANEEKAISILSDADIIYVTGGNTFFLLEKMKACKFEQAIRAALSRGAIYIGSSAGTAACCPDIDYVATMDDPSVAKLDNTRGLNLVDFLVMVHMDNIGFAEKTYGKVREMKSGIFPVICLKDDQALFIDGQSVQIICA